MTTNIKDYSLSLISKKKIFYKIGLNIKKNNFNLTKKNQNYLIFKKKKNKNLAITQKTNKFFYKIKNYKNYRNSLGYPIRGQRTHTNAKTKKKFKNLFKKIW